MKNTSWNHHSSHINPGLSCSVCHTAHGMGAVSGTITGERLVNFDVNVVASNGGLPISYNRAANTCVLVCHHGGPQSQRHGYGGWSAEPWNQEVSIAKIWRSS